MGYGIEAEVGEDGMVHVAIPGTAPGEKVKLEVTREERIRRAAENYDKRIGWLKGKIEILPSFDDPIEGLP